MADTAPVYQLPFYKQMTEFNMYTENSLVMKLVLHVISILMKLALHETYAYA